MSLDIMEAMVAPSLGLMLWWGGMKICGKKRKKMLFAP